MVCKICENYESNTFRGLSLHIVNKHKMRIKEYYDTYLIKEKEGICICGNKTRFKSLTNGYFQYCSSRCNATSLKTKQLRKQTNLERYGNENYVNAKKSSETWKNKTLEEYNKIIKQRKETKKEKYGDEFYTNREGAKQTCIQKYGVQNPFQIVGIQQKIKQTNLNNFGVDHPMKSDRIKINVKEKLKKYYTDKITILFNEFFYVRDYKDENNIIVQCKSCNNVYTIQKQYFVWRINKNIHPCYHCCDLSNISVLEKDLLNFIKLNYNGNIITNSKDIIKPYELDIYLPDLKLAFEFNGLFWHNELNVENNYHLNKTEECEKQGIHLVQIYEDDWVYKQDIVKSRILNLLGKSIKIPARKCEIKEVSFEESKEFLEKNHIQGNCISKIQYGLYFDKELISVMTFSNLRKSLGKIKKEGSFELLRFCNKLGYSVIGGANRLFKYFLKQYDPKEVISYADRSWTSKYKNFYQKIGFKFDGKTAPGYFYIVNKVRMNRFMFRKSELIKQGFDSNKSEKEIMLERKIYRIYNSGNLRFVWMPYV